MTRRAIARMASSQNGRAVDAFVVGRLSADLYPLQINTPLEDVRTFEKFVGGFAGNVATGLARLGVAVAIVSAVGDDGHGRFVRRFLSDEGVDVRWLGTHPTLRTALAFCEAWPPDNFPLTFYRDPTCPDWELRLADVPFAELVDAPLVYVTGTGLAREPSLIVTVDNGISSAAGVADARARGIDVLITDHHLPGLHVPAANVIVGTGSVSASNVELFYLALPVQMRTAPTVTVTVGTFKVNSATGGVVAATGLTGNATHTVNAIGLTATGTGTAGQATPRGTALCQRQ